MPITKILNRESILLVALGSVSLALYARGSTAIGISSIVWFIKLALLQSILYLVAVWIVLRARPSRSSLIIAIIFAALFRLSILFAPPYLSDDIYRYIWDGRVQAAGVNPYRYVPADESLSRLRDETIYTHINRRDYAHTIYPPIAEAIYFLATRISERVTWMKIVMVGFEVLTLWALIRLLVSFDLPPQRALIYAWHPLIVWEIAGSGHVDAAVIAFVALALLARRRNLESVTGIMLACATLIKLFPIVMFPALYRRWGWRMPLAFVVTVIIAYAPYLNAGATGVLGFLPGYATEEGMQNGTRFYLLNLAQRAFGEANVPNSFFVIFALVVLGIVAGWSFLKKERTNKSYITRAFVLAATFTLLLSPHYAWYFAWLVPLMCLLSPIYLMPFFYLTLVGFVTYESWLGDKPNQIFAFSTFLYIPFVILCVVAFVIHSAAARKQERERHPSSVLPERELI